MRRSRQAFDLLGSSQARRAFRLEEEPEANRDRYGQTPFGQRVLLARRLVEAGVRLVQVNWYRGADEPPANPCWDSHVSESARLKDVLVPPTDRAYSALLEDLHRRGLLDETLVVCMAEFGRTPRLDGNGGRNHWGSVFSVTLAGGGVRGRPGLRLVRPDRGLPRRGPSAPRGPVGHDLSLPGLRPGNRVSRPARPAAPGEPGRSHSCHFVSTSNFNVAVNGSVLGMVQITRFAGTNSLSPFAPRKTMNPAGQGASVPQL